MVFQGSKSELPKAKVPLEVVIVGAGLGGVTGAISLALSGHKVTLLEQAPKLGEVGAGIQIPPPSVRILHSIGAYDLVKAKSVVPNNVFVYRWEDGTHLSTQNLVPLTQDMYGSDYLHIHRADYHAALVERAKELGVSILLSCHVAEIDFENLSVKCANGDVYKGDVVVGYDGIKSKTRSAILGREDPPYTTGDMAFRALVDIENIKHDAKLTKLFKEPNISFWWGPNCHLVIYLLQGGNTINIVALCPDNLDEGLTIQDSSKDELKEILAGWDPNLLNLLDYIHETKKWKLQNSRELSTWTHDVGNVIILGDASHATLPYLASGASQALEDAAVLAGLLARVEDKSQIHDVLKITENLRKWRSTQVVQGSTNCRNIYHLPDGPEQVARDEALKADPPTVGCPNRWADPKFRDFLFDYDAFAEAERGWNEYKKGKFATYFIEDLYKL
ncbi:CIC11C00000001199 [Sungouiella intermedia]|uniref:CIC11C00000001199 n=1 Tax=Sungouiella intermedia TaxID=45354 RepID=A0A1L0BQF7_9ASCO|nr:CIC11C00000001199 [[Candida] intermedia]